MPKQPGRSQMRYKKMNRMGVMRYRYLLTIPILIAAIAITAWIRLPPLEMKRFRPIHYGVNNPLMGWAIDAKSDPELVNVPHTLVHAQLTWRELEPERGEYDFEAFEQLNHIDIWRARGMRGVLRFVMDVPSEHAHMDIPQWLFDELGEAAGGPYQTARGMGFSPDYGEFTLMAAHKRAIEAMGARYNDDPFFAFVELGSIGHNGEWWVDENAPPLPLMLQVRDYFNDYGMAFPNTRLMATSPYQSAKLLQAGLYNPYFGEAERSWDWLDLALYGGYEKQLGVELRGAGIESYKSMPHAAQFSPLIDAEALLSQRPERLIDQLKESHATYISKPPAESLSDQIKDNMSIVHEAMGYRLWVRSVQWQRGARGGESLPIGLQIRNGGAAPMSESWPVRVLLLNESGDRVATKLTRIDTRKLMPGETKINESIDVPIDLPKGEYRLAIEIIDPATGEAAVQWAMYSDRIGLVSVLGNVKIG